MTTAPLVTLNNEATIPQLGFGVFQVPNEEVKAPVLHAIASGYRLIDSAAVYGNEVGVGEAVGESGVRREDLFVTTKVWNDRQGYDETMRAFDESLGKLGMDYVDLYLIHWPAPARDSYVDTYRALEKLHADGRARSIGVSNFLVPHLKRLLDETSVVPVLNQIELSPQLQQRELRAFHREHGIATEAYSPLARGGDVLSHPVVTELAARHDRTPGQIVLRWHVQLGNIVIPKSVTPERISSNIDVFDFELSPAEMAAFEGLETGVRTAPDPATFGA